MIHLFVKKMVWGALSVGALSCLMWVGIGDAHAAVRVNEISYNPPGTDANLEWIEVVNDGLSPVDLTNWKLDEGGTYHALTLTQGSLTLPPNGYAVLTGSGAVFVDDHIGYANTILDTSFSLNNTGETLGLIDGDGNAADTVAYSSTLANGNGFTLERNAAGQWVQSLVTFGTPGEENSVIASVSILSGSGATIMPGDLLINEFQATPATGQSEWIELYNASNHAIDLSFLTIEDATGTPHILSGSLNPGEYVVLEPSPVSLNNSGDMIVLRRASDGIIVDLVMYGSSVPATASGSSILPTASGAVLPATGSTSSPSLTGSGSTSPFITAVSVTGKSIGAYFDSSLTGSGRALRVFSQPTKGLANAVNNHAPIAVITVQSPGHTSGSAPLSLNVTAESSFDPDGDELSYLWEYGDGTTSASSNPPEKRYESAGTFLLKLTVTDGWSASSTATGSIVVATPATGGGGGGGSATGSSSFTGSPAANTASTPCTTRTMTAKLIINEILPNPAGSDTAGEFIEIYNDEPSPVNLCGWSIDDGESGSKPHVFTTDTIIGAKGYKAFYVGAFNVGLNNDEDAARILSPEGKEISSVKYAKVEEGKSYSRFILASKETWEWIIPTPDRANEKGDAQPKGSGESTSPIRINELFPNPTGADGDREFIELYNTGERTNMKGWKIKKGSSEFVFEQDTFIEADSFLLLGEGQTKLTLVNVSETVELLNGEGNSVQSVSYEAAPSEQSWSFFQYDAKEYGGSQDMFSTWTWGDPTPGEANRVLGQTALSADQQTFSVVLRQGRKVLYLEGVTAPNADVALALFHVAEDDSLPAEPDVELRARSGTRSGKYSIAIPIVLPSGTYRIVATIKPDSGAEFTNNESRIEIRPDAQQANEVKPTPTTKKSSSSAKVSTTSRKPSSIVPEANAEEYQTDFGPFIGGGAEGMEDSSSKKMYLYAALILFLLAGGGMIVLGKVKMPGK